MYDLRTFRRSIRQELASISDTLKRLEYAAATVRGARRRLVRTELKALRRLRDGIMRRLLSLRSTNGVLCMTTERRVREDIVRVRMGCRALELQLR